MPSGRVHDASNLILLLAILGLLVGHFFQTTDTTLFFSLGWLFSTFIFSPDADLGPRRRVGFIFYCLLYPYSRFVKHRGLSHSFFLGTLGRVIYLSVIILLILLAFYLYGKTVQWEQFSHWSWKRPPVLWGEYFVLGMFGADCAHILLDRAISVFKIILGR